MAWLVVAVSLAVGVVGLVALAVITSHAVRRARGASRILGVAMVGRSTRMRAGIEELNTWRARRRDADGSAANA